MEIGGNFRYKLYLKVVNLFDLKPLIEKGILPIGVIMPDVKDIDVETYNTIEKYYFESDIYDTTYLPTILSLNLAAIEELFKNDNFTLTHLIDGEEQVYKIDGFHTSLSPDIPMCIRVVKRKNLFQKKRKIREVGKLVQGTIIEKIVELRQATELTQTQIDEIHKNNMLTPAEKVVEWESSACPCVPNGVIIDRCYYYEDCHSCLVDFAYMKHAHDKFESNLKIVNISFDEVKPILRKNP